MGLTDALRLSDGKTVMLKKIFSEESGYGSELKIGQFVSSLKQMQDPDNHCVPIYEVLNIPDDPNHVLIVMPLLREIDDPRFDTVGEGLECIYQLLRVSGGSVLTMHGTHDLLQGIRYLHRNHIAHR